MPPSDARATVRVVLIGAASGRSQAGPSPRGGPSDGRVGPLAPFRPLRRGASRRACRR
jgi:hypothetical protein